MVTTKNLILEIVLLIAEVALITFLNYRVAGSFYSLDVLYCLPIIQAARLGAIRALRRSDSHMPLIVGVLCAATWSLAEVAISWPAFPVSAFLMNVVTRSVTFTIIGRVVTKLWKEREYSRKDTLTELANRLEFTERFEVEQRRSSRSGRPYSLLFIDIDQFKVLNDIQGHHIGDEALRVVAQLLKKNTRMVDTVARLGGDEFVVLFTETDERTCEMLVRRILSTAKQEFTKRAWPISLSIGQVTDCGRHRSTDEMLQLADEKMYLSKKAKQ
jgi:diguanylate cyclase (GGDEF)-like protein